ncbi:Bacterial conjugation TrbI-like protein [compost metagenome]
MQKPNEEQAPDNLSEQPESKHARGSFDLRPTRPKKSGQTKLYAMLGGIVVLAVAGLVWVWSAVLGGVSTHTNAVDETTVVADAALQRGQADDESLDKLQARKLQQMQKEEDDKARLAAQQEEKASTQTSAQPTSKPAEREAAATSTRTKASSSNAKDNRPTPAQRRMAGGVVIQAAGGNSRSASKVTTDEEEQDKAAAGSDERGSLGNLGGTRFASTKAKPAPDGTYLLAHNTYARCALYTEIITDNPALIECRLTDPLYSANGQTVIADAGARLFGEQRVSIKSGQQRVFTAWTEMEANNGTEKPVRVRLDSLGAGPMGASGTQAWIDNHWSERFGASLMLSLFQDVMQGVSNTTQKSSNDGYTVNNSERNVESMAEKALDSTINIPPTGYILPGTVMTVIVARDIDFSTVYQNR